MEIKNKSDFVISVIIKDWLGQIIDYMATDWDIDFFTTPNSKYTVSCKNGVLHRKCEIVEDTVNEVTIQKVLVYVDAFDFVEKGVLYQETTVLIPDTHFDDGNMKLPDLKQLNIVII